jgi:hypothetical protein
MRSLRRTAAAALAAAGMLTAPFLLPAGSAAAATIAPQGQPSPNVTYYVCANGGEGLCLQNNGEVGSAVANDNKINPPSSNTHQLWTFVKVGDTSASAPFTHPDLDKFVTAGRSYGRWKTNTGLCLAELGGAGVPIGLADCSAAGTEWVLSGSGRMINVQVSDSAYITGEPTPLDNLWFLNSNQVNGQDPFLHPNEDGCPQACWGPNAG